MVPPATRSADRQPIRFPAWKQALARADFSDAVRERHRRAILGFLKYCKDRRAPASVVVIRGYLATADGPGAREALAWFWRAAQGGAATGPAATRSAELAGVKPAPQAAAGGEASAGSASTSPAAPERVARAAVPPRAAEDRGGADWERDLVAAVRSRGFLWRTEETYREWGRRFARFLEPRSPYAAEAGDVGAFLTELATGQRASPSTQKQALNAVVFLMQEALHRHVGEIVFRRAAPRERMPTVSAAKSAVGSSPNWKAPSD